MGQELASCPLVIEGFVRRTQKAKKAPYIWQTVDRVWANSGVQYALQHRLQQGAFQAALRQQRAALLLQLHP